ncbi:hypothetical protein V8V80_18725 [Niallia taxi]
MICRKINKEGSFRIDCFFFTDTNSFTIFANSQLENEQSGNRVDIEEQSLVGSNNGD